MFSLSLYAAFFALVNSLFPALWTAMGSRRVVQEEISQNRVKKKQKHLQTTDMVHKPKSLDELANTHVPSY